MLSSAASGLQQPVDASLLAARARGVFVAGPPSLASRSSPSCALPAANATATFLLQDATGHRSYDLGNGAACELPVSAGGPGGLACVLQLGGDGGLPAGLCLPAGCGAGDLIDSSSPAWLALAQYAFESIPTFWAIEFSYLFSLPVVVTCENEQLGGLVAGGAGTSQAVSFSWGAGAIATAAALGALAACVALATAADAARAWPLARAISLATTVPALLSGNARASARAQGGGKAADAAPWRADTRAMDGVRALSAMLVVLGHSLFFPLFDGSPGAVSPGQLGALVAQAAMQVFPSAEFAVDSFFMLSGALGAYIGGRKLRKALPAALTAAAGAPLILRWPPPLLLACSRRARAPAAGDRAPTLGAALAGGGVFAGAWAYAVVSRYIRIVPLLAAVYGIYVYLAPLLGTGPFWWRWQEQAVVPCTQNNGALYLFTFTSNVLPRDGSTAGFGCGGWFWYLANDFQFHAVLPLLLLVWAVNSDAGCLVLGALVVSFVGATYHIVDSNNISALTDIGGANEAIGLGGDYDWHFYTQPVTRAPAFLVGVGLAFALLRVEDAGGARIDGEADADKALPAGAAAVAVALAGDVARALLPTRPDARGGPRVVCWVSTAALAACLALLGWLFYIPTLHYVGAAATPLGPLWSRATVVAWTVLARPAWAAALAGVVFLAALGRAGAVGALLSAPAWAPWSRLAFALYVIHPVVLGVTGLALRQLVDYSPQWIASSFAHTLALSAAAAAALYLVVELPCAAAQRLLLEPAVASALRAAARAGAVAGRCLNLGERAATDDGDDGDPAVDDRKAALLGVQ